jgi:hypothetical protein
MLTDYTDYIEAAMRHATYEWIVASPDHTPAATMSRCGGPDGAGRAPTHSGVISAADSWREFFATQPSAGTSGRSVRATVLPWRKARLAIHEFGGTDRAARSSPMMT